MGSLCSFNLIKKCGGKRGMLSGERLAYLLVTEIIVIICFLSNAQTTVFTKSREVRIEQNAAYVLEWRDKAVFACSNDGKINFLTYKNNPHGDIFTDAAPVKINKLHMEAIYCERDFNAHGKNAAQPNQSKMGRHALLFKPFDCDKSNAAGAGKARVYCAYRAKQQQPEDGHATGNLTDEIDDLTADSSLVEAEEQQPKNGHVINNLTGDSSLVETKRKVIQHMADKHRVNFENKRRKFVKKEILIEGSPSFGFNKTITTPSGASTSHIPATNGTVVISALEGNAQNTASYKINNYKN